MFGLFGRRGVEIQGVASVPYIYNDPAVANLVGMVPLPPIPQKLNFIVKGYNRGVVQANTPAAQAAGCYVTIANGCLYVNNRMSMFTKKLEKWAATSKLIVSPREGRMLNAYYDRAGLKFFYDYNPKTKKMIYTAESPDIVAHELGHAILDAIRPDLWSTQAIEVWSFHEAFGDMMAMLCTMQYDAVLQYALHETQNNLRLSNVVSNVAEEMGQCIYAQTHDGSENALRSAVNNFIYTDPNKLPTDGPASSLVAECHSFSRVFTGAFYDIFVGIYEHEMKTHTPIDAMKIARDVVGDYLFRALPRAPRVVKFFNGMAKTMLAVDQSKGGPYQDIMKTVFKERRLALPEVKILSDKTWGTMKFEIEKHDAVMRNQKVTVVRLVRQKFMTLADHQPEIATLSANGFDLHKAILDVPGDSYYEFDHLGRLVDEILPNDEEIMDAAFKCVNDIAQREEVGNDSHTMWELKKNKLIRTLII